MKSNIVISGLFVAVLVAVGAYFDGRFTDKPAPEQQAISGTIIKNIERAQESVVQEVKDNSLSRIKESGIIRVGVQNPSKPFFSGDVRPTGFNIDFLKLLLSQNEFGGDISVNTDNQVDNYEAIPGQLLDNKKLDIVIDGLTFNNSDLPGVVYSIPYVKDFGYSLITLKGITMASKDDTAGAKIGVLQGDPDAKSFAELAFPDAKIVELSDRVDSNGKWIIGHIKSGKVDAVMYDYPFAVAEVENTDLQFSITKIEGSDIQYKIGVRKEDKELLSALNSAIRKAINDDSYPELLKTYFMTKQVIVQRASSAEEVYVVSKGDTLSTIAQNKLGDKMKYSVIQSRNNLANPNFISVGQKLVIPR